MNDTSFLSCHFFMMHFFFMMHMVDFEFVDEGATHCNIDVGAFFFNADDFARFFYYS